MRGARARWIAPRPFFALCNLAATPFLRRTTRRAGYLTETEGNTVRAAMRFSLDEKERAKFEAVQVRRRAGCHAFAS